MDNYYDPKLSFVDGIEYNVVNKHVYPFCPALHFFVRLHCFKLLVQKQVERVQFWVEWTDTPIVNQV